MEELYPRTPLSLVTLCVSAIVKNSRRDDFKLDVDKILPPIGELIYQKCTVMGLIQIASNPNLSEWFLPIIRSKFTKIDIKLENESDMEIYFLCDTKPAMVWRFIPALIKNSKLPVLFHLKVFGEMSIPVNPINNGFNVHRFQSQIYHFNYSKLNAIADWVDKMFNKPIWSLRVHDKSAVTPELLNFAPLRTAVEVHIEYCKNSRFYEMFAPLRKESYMQTKIDFLDFPNSTKVIDPSYFRLLPCQFALLNLSKLELPAIIEFAKEMFNTFSLCRAQIPDMDDQDLEVFRNALNLSKSTIEFEIEHQSPNFDGHFSQGRHGEYKQFIHISEKGEIKVFRFVEKLFLWSSGMFNEMQFGFWNDTRPLSQFNAAEASAHDLFALLNALRL